MRHDIHISGRYWTKKAAEQKIGKFIWATKPKLKQAQDVPLSQESQAFIREYIVGGPLEQELGNATEIVVKWLHRWKWSPCLLFRLPGGEKRFGYRSLRDPIETRTRKRELRIMRDLTKEYRDCARKHPADHVDDVAPGTFEWRARLFKQHWLMDHSIFDISDKNTQKHWRKFYQVFELESVSATVNYQRKKKSDRRKRLALKVEAAAPQGVKSLRMDRDALLGKWENDGGWDVPEIAYYETEWLDLSPLNRGRARIWLASFV